MATTTQQATLTGKISTLVEPALENMGYRLVQVRFRENSAGRSLQIMAEHQDDSTMTVDDCADISHMLSALLDVEDPIGGPYQLEISSPGIDRPLIRLEDFTRHMGYEIKLETVLPIAGRKRFRGKLAKANDTAITVEYDKESAEILIDNIHSAKLVLTDDLIREHLRKSKQHQKGKKKE